MKATNCIVLDTLGNAEILGTSPLVVDILEAHPAVDGAFLHANI